jgi:outer membrane protein TolC
MADDQKPDQLRLAVDELRDATARLKQALEEFKRAKEGLRFAQKSFRDTKARVRRRICNDRATVLEFRRPDEPVHPDRR